MFNYEWQKVMKEKYLDLAHVMQVPLNGDKTAVVNDIRAANELIGACQQYIAEQVKDWFEELGE